MTEIAVGLVGYGLGGSTFHAPFIDTVPGLRLATVVTSRKDLVAGDYPDARVAPTVAELLADPEIGLVVISSPTPTHYEVAYAALNAGKHVVIDKPMTATVEQADTLIQLAASRGRMLTVYQNRRWDGDFLTVQHAIKQGWLGEVYYYEAHFDRFRPQIKQGWRESAEQASGILYDLGAHLIDQALVLFGMPDAVTADVFTQRPAARAIDYFHVILHFGRKRAVLHSATLVRAPGPHFAVHGDAGSFLKYGMDPQEEALMAGKRPGDPRWGVDQPEHYGILTSADGSRAVETIRGSYETFYERIVSCLRDGAPPPVDPKDSRSVLAVIEAAIRSALERRTV